MINPIVPQNDIHMEEVKFEEVKFEEPEEEHKGPDPLIEIRNNCQLFKENSLNYNIFDLKKDISFHKERTHSMFKVRDDLIAVQSAISQITLIDTNTLLPVHTMNHLQAHDFQHLYCGLYD